MEYKYKKENHDFWVDRLKKNPKNQVCTNDVLLDKIETQQILNILKDDCSILEVGCGNGLLYQEIKKKFNNFL